MQDYLKVTFPLTFSQGEFGKVILGTVSASLPNNTEHALIDVRGTVAVKMLKGDHSDQGHEFTVVSDFQSCSVPERIKLICKP